MLMLMPTRVCQNHQARSLWKTLMTIGVELHFLQTHQQSILLALMLMPKMVWGLVLMLIHLARVSLYQTMDGAVAS